MQCLLRSARRLWKGRPFRWLAVVMLAGCFASASSLRGETPVQLNRVDRLLDGVLARSFIYHRDRNRPQHALHPRPATHQYGFPVSSYRWGWFGANYYPRTLSHRGYYGNTLSWGYRKGY